MKLFKLTLAVAMAAFFIAGTTAQATDRTFDANGAASGSWNVAANWTDDVVPVAGDKAIILTGKTADVDTANDICGQLDIQGTGRVVIKISSKLTIDGNGTALTSMIAVSAKLILETSTSVLEIKDDNHTMSGSGKIIGQDNEAVITDAASEKLTIDTDLTVQGALKITLDMENNGTVRANDGSSGSRDTLELGGGETFTGDGDWQAYRDGTAGTRVDAILKFASGVTATGLTGAFRVSAYSILDVDANVCTTGNLLFDGGTIDVAVGKSFKAGGSCQ